MMFAQSTSASEAAILAGIHVNRTPAGGAIISATFSTGIPVFHLVGAGTQEAVVILDGTAIGQIAPTIAGLGPVSSISIAQAGSSSSIALHLSTAAGVRVRSSGASILIEVSPAPTAVIAGEATPAPRVLQHGGQTGAEITTEVVPLNYADISEIAGILVSGSAVVSNDTFAPSQTNIGTSSFGGSFGGLSGGPSGSFGTGYAAQQQQQFGGAFGQQQGLAQRLSDDIAVDRRLNAVILTGTRDVVAGYKELIKKIDIPIRGVILETQVVEISSSAARNIGFDFSPDGSGILANSIGGNSYTIKSLQPGNGSVNLQAALYAQISLGNAKIIAKPRILAQSGQQASILTGDAIPILTSVVVAGAGSITSQQVNYVNVGVNLQIQPRVSADGFVTSHIYSEVSSVTNFVSGVPQISQRTANTTATVRDGEAFVIGGLLQDNEIRSLVKVPFIGDLPLIGVFFRHLNTSHTQTNLYIVVTPHIVNYDVRAVPTTAITPSNPSYVLPKVPVPASPIPRSTALR